MTIANILSDELAKFFIANKKSKTFMTEVASFFPPLSGVILECKLDQIYNIDVSFPFHRNLNQFSFFSNTNQLNKLPVRVLESKSWKGIFKISELLDDPFIMPELKLIWLEFDEALFYNYIQTPGIFFNFNRLSFFEIIETIEIISQNKISLNIHSNIKKIVALFPLDLRKGDIGIFLGRVGSPIRFSVIVSKKELYEYGNYQKSILPHNIVFILSKLSSYIQLNNLRLNINVGENIIAQSIEIKSNAGEWNAVLHLLSEYGWCVKEIQKKINDWSTAIQYDSFEVHRSYYKPPLHGICLPQFTIRKISHIKLLFSNNEKIAKAYLAEGYVWEDQ